MKSLIAITTISFLVSVSVLPILVITGEYDLPRISAAACLSNSLVDITSIAILLNVLTILCITTRRKGLFLTCCLVLLGSTIFTTVKATCFNFRNFYLTTGFILISCSSLIPALFLVCLHAFTNETIINRVNSDENIPDTRKDISLEYTLLEEGDNEQGRLANHIVKADSPRNASHRGHYVKIFAWGGIASFVRGWLYSVVGERIVKRVRQALFKAIILQDVVFFDTNRTGELMNRLSSDTTTLQSALSVNVSMGLRSGAQVIFALIFLFLTSWKLAAVMISIVPPLVLVAMAYGQYVRELSRQYQDALAQAAETGNESIANARVMRSFGAEQLEYHRYAEAITRSYEKGVLKALVYGVFAGGMGLAGGVAILGVIYYGARLVISGSIGVGELTSFILYTLYMTAGLATLSSLYTELMNALGATKRIFQLLEMKPTIDIFGGGLWPPLGEVRGAVRFTNINFQYPSRDGPILSNFNLDVSPRQTVAIVGMSGAGKSTLLSLLQRFYETSSTDTVHDSQDGIFIDGYSIKDLDPLWLRRILSAVPQDPVLFSVSIRENIGYARAAAIEADKVRSRNGPDFCEKLPTDDDIIHAAKQANAHEFIMSFPDKYDTLVGERGVRLSGGQKQRIAIARALLADPRILLLDEATSALDSESEALVQAAINQITKNRTVFVVAHRLSTVRSADVIVMLEDGHVVASGRHEDLLRDSPEYMQLVQRQLSTEEKELRVAQSPVYFDENAQETCERRLPLSADRTDGLEATKPAGLPGVPKMGPEACDADASPQHNVPGRDSADCELDRMKGRTEISDEGFRDVSASLEADETPDEASARIDASDDGDK